MLVAQIVFERFTDIDVFLARDLLHRVRRPDWNVKLLGTASHHTSVAGLTIPMHGRVEEAAGADAVLFMTKRFADSAAHRRRIEATVAMNRAGSMGFGR